MPTTAGISNKFSRLERLPPYAFTIIGDLKTQLRQAGADVIDLGMGNPDQPTPKHIVDKLTEVAQRPHVHRYSTSKGIPRLRKAICDWYQQRFAVDLDPDTEAIVTIGSKEGLAHLALATMEKGDTVIVPDPAYPIHPFGFVIAGADILRVPLEDENQFFAEAEQTIKRLYPKPKMLLLNFPANPSTHCVELEFFERAVALAREHNIWLVQDIAYADLVYDGYQPPSILQVPGAKDVAVEFFSLSKSYNMPGWRIGFCCGNPTLIGALTKIKSYLDYGIYTPAQVAAITALEGPQECVAEIREMYRSRRDVLCDGLNSIGWPVEKPKATMFVWAKIPEQFRTMGSIDFSKMLVEQCHVAVSPGIGFGDYGDSHVRFALIENEQRIRQAVRNLKQVFR